MVRFCLTACSMLFCAMGFLHAQESREPNEGRVEELLERLEKHDRKAALELGTLGDKSAIPKLREDAKRRGRRRTVVAENAQMALAKLGDEEAYSEILTELESDLSSVVYRAINKLKYIGDDRAIAALGNLLDDDKFRIANIDRAKGNPRMRRDLERLHTHYETPAKMAARALSSMVDEISDIGDARVTAEHLRICQEWWKNSKSRYLKKAPIKERDPDGTKP